MQKIICIINAIRLVWRSDRLYSNLIGQELVFVWICWSSYNPILRPATKFKEFNCFEYTENNILRKPAIRYSENFRNCPEKCLENFRNITNCQKTLTNVFNPGSWKHSIGKSLVDPRIFGSCSAKLAVAYNKLFINRVCFSYCKILRPPPLRTDLACSARTTSPWS